MYMYYTFENMHVYIRICMCSCMSVFSFLIKLINYVNKRQIGEKEKNF